MPSCLIVSRDVAELNALIGHTEDLHLDCKTWPQRDDAAQGMLAKALCGFANAEGGVIVIGFEAKSAPSKYDPDIIQQAVPVADAMGVKAKIEGLVGDLVEPRLQGVMVAAVPATPGSKAGFVLVAIPPTDGLPCRSRKNQNFYQRISSGTYPMEYFQIADMFGKRHRPQLSFYLEVGESEYRRPGPPPERELTIGIENRGRAVAKFPRLSFKRVPGFNMNHWGIDGNGGLGLPQLPTEPELIVFGGGADHVIHPGTVLKIAKVDQRAKVSEWVAAPGGAQTFYFEEFTFVVELSADEVPSRPESKIIPRYDILS